jgi:tetratricopeptide (TPR) repeat protein
MIEGKTEEAEAEARFAVSLDPKSAYGFWLLGRILAEAGRFVEARVALEQSIVLNPKLGGAYYDLVRTGRIEEADRPLIKQMQKVVGAIASQDQCVRVHFAIGKALDDLGEYGPAMQHFEEANRIKATLGSFDRNAFVQRVDAAIERITPDLLATHRGSSKSDLLVAVVGMPRSGTTLVEQIISNHDKVVGGGEMQFWSLHAPLFDEATDPASIEEFQRRTASDGVGTLSAVAPDAARVVDKNPFNFLWAGVIHLVFPCAVIIHCRRDPIDTCLSAFSTYFRQRSDFSTDRDDLVFYYRQYLRLMAHWRATLSPERFVEVDYETLVADPEQASRRLIGACGLEWQQQCLRPEDNRRVVRSASRWQARQPIYRAAVGRWRRYEPWIGSFRELEVGPPSETVT